VYAKKKKHEIRIFVLSFWIILPNFAVEEWGFREIPLHGRDLYHGRELDCPYICNGKKYL
jgi:hypothetical protein